MSTQHIIILESDITPKECRENLKCIYTTIPSQHFSSRKINKVINNTPYEIQSLVQRLSCHMHTKLAQLRANRSPLLQSYLYTVNPDTYMPQCLLLVKHTNITLTISSTVVKCQHNTTPLV